MVDKYRLRLYHHNVCTREWNGKSGEYCSNCNVAKYFREILLRNMNWYYSWIIWLRNTENDKSYIIRGVWGIEMQTAEVAQGQLLCRNSTQLLWWKLLSQKTWKAPLMETHENLENSWLMAMEDRRNSLKWHDIGFQLFLNFLYDRVELFIWLFWSLIESHQFGLCAEEHIVTVKGHRMAMANQIYWLTFSLNIFH